MEWFTPDVEISDMMVLFYRNTTNVYVADILESLAAGALWQTTTQASSAAAPRITATGLMPRSTYVSYIKIRHASPKLAT
jgi:hypothetical protein